MNVQISIIREYITEESAEQSDIDRAEYLREDEIVSVRDAIDELSRCSEVSSWPLTPANARHVWASTESQMDMYSGEYESESVHVKRADGSDLSARQMFRLLRAAGLAKGTL